MKPKRIKITSETLVYTYGLELNKEYDCQECPDEYKNKYDNDVWVYSIQRDEIVRCLPREYIIVS